MALLEAERAHLLGYLQSIEPRSIHELGDMWEFLRVSELMLLDILQGRPENPDYAGRGDPEVGHLLYHLNNPGAELLAMLEAEPFAKAAWRLIAHDLLPESRIGADFFQGLQATARSWPIVGSDGTLYGFGQYESLDPRWIEISLNMVITFAQGVHPFGSKPYRGELAANKDGKVRLGIVGDWGGGSGENDSSPAAAVMRQLAAQGGDYLIHMGDVYYAGTGGAPHIPENQEAVNFTSLWPRQYAAPGRSFTLNSNHEMYSGANGYFPLALGGDIFRHQNMTSYFGLTFGQWVILGLDSAYHAAAGSFYLQGVLGEQQSAWIRQFGEDIGGFGGKKILVLTHHEGQDMQGRNLTPLHHEITSAIGRAPDVWYWGHLHNGIVYGPASAAGRQNVRARCVGHSAIPFGVAPGLLDASGNRIAGVEYFARTSSPAGGNRVLNGFATLELDPNGGIAEAYYEQGNPAPVWSARSGRDAAPEDPGLTSAPAREPEPSPG